ncbi:MAG: hypothetical protein M3Y81_11380 [Chloroflexota bacterium]|nr:hypothetical protein [Chloroflexota bacterium]
MPKLQPPRLPSTLVPRGRLLARLDRGLEGSLTLISAPAGSGKTTLVRQWMSERDASTGGSFPAIAWVSLDAGDNDPMRFWRYVITACQTFQISQAALALLPTRTQALVKPAFLETLLTTLLNDLASLSSKSVLVLEDYHILTSPQLHESVTFFLEHLPATLHVILMSRAEPSLPLARLRASGNLSELSVADLRFSRQETEAFLHQLTSLHLSEVALHHLDIRLQGWAAGLRLLTLSLQEHLTQEEPEQALTRLEGRQRPLLDYFVSEVLAVQPEPLQAFLLQTCMLSRLNDSLCNAVTGRQDGALVLDSLERMNLFLERLDGPGHWYRYHALFAEAMQHIASLRSGEEHLHYSLQQASH